METVISLLEGNENYSQSTFYVDSEHTYGAPTWSHEFVNDLSYEHNTYIGEVHSGGNETSYIIYSPEGIIFNWSVTHSGYNSDTQEYCNTVADSFFHLLKIVE